MNRKLHVEKSQQRTVLPALLVVVRVVAVVHETRLMAMAFFMSGWDDGMGTNSEVL